MADEEAQPTTPGSEATPQQEAQQQQEGEQQEQQQQEQQEGQQQEQQQDGQQQEQQGQSEAAPVDQAADASQQEATDEAPKQEGEGEQQEEPQPEQSAGQNEEGQQPQEGQEGQELQQEHQLKQQEQQQQNQEQQPDQAQSNSDDGGAGEQTTAAPEAGRPSISVEDYDDNVVLDDDVAQRLQVVEAELEKVRAEKEALRSQVEDALQRLPDYKPKQEQAPKEEQEAAPNADTAGKDYQAAQAAAEGEKNGEKEAAEGDGKADAGAGDEGDEAAPSTDQGDQPSEKEDDGKAGDQAAGEAKDEGEQQQPAAESSGEQQQHQQEQPTSAEEEQKGGQEEQSAQGKQEEEEDEETSKARHVLDTNAELERRIHELEAEASQLRLGNSSTASPAEGRGSEGGATEQPQEGESTQSSDDGEDEAARAMSPGDRLRANIAKVEEQLAQLHGERERANSVEEAEDLDAAIATKEQELAALQDALESLGPSPEEIAARKEQERRRREEEERRARERAEQEHAAALELKQRRMAATQRLQALQRDHDALTSRNAILQANLAELLRRRFKDQKPLMKQGEARLRYQGILKDLARFATEDQDTKTYYTQELARLHDLQAVRTEEVAQSVKAYAKLRRRVALQSISSRNGTRLRANEFAPMDKDYEEKEEELAASRRKHYRLKATLEQAQHEMREKDKMSGGLHLIDFEQLKIENQTGKSHLANFLSDTITSTDGVDYLPTRGCRILEFDAETDTGRRSDMSVELWDVSGDMSYENVWPAMAQGAHGAIIVFDINKMGQENDLGPWFKTFVKRAGLRSGQCVVFANNPSTESPTRSDVAIEGPLSKARLYSTDISERPDEVRQAFNQLMVGVRELVLARREKEENQMLGM
ncbi:hypothetical protein PTSG_04119 [Salpingoeca rosetta]|uniref:CCDC113/CCDC96 coiled-coil domain-containing protein n=1 Tax=Salpingoeca rosetta (strain ATCC 50818 / BSB-021) TaxID=946362 RepID=F2U6M9_SALR5|nr:uncharacterized protein PTSG_04119 [Salpingoeca rosetta]EGD83511.1 hypothetical protein PTSG_04119 [Salpingoeca rosetta]|eukprot:XP_004995015.1 hypothetical protein PTSG_04119 [Salpingoeca rosetta]